MNPFFFIQLADPQFGMFARWGGVSDEVIEAQLSRGFKIRKAPSVTGFEDEPRLFTEAISEANRLKPAFVVVCGDMVNNPVSEDERAEVLRIAGKLDPNIPIHWVPGNHDVAFDHNNPSEKCLAIYKKHFGDDYYSFTVENVKFIVINSTILTTPENMEDQAIKQMEFIESEIPENHQNSSRETHLTKKKLYLASDHHS